MTAKKSLKIPPNFMCKICVYNTSSKKDYNKHLLTPKHQNATNTAKKGEINPDILFSCDTYLCHCGKEYKHRQSLSKHKKSVFKRRNKRRKKKWNKNQMNQVIKN